MSKKVGAREHSDCGTNVLKRLGFTQNKLWQLNSVFRIPIRIRIHPDPPHFAGSGSGSGSTHGAFLGSGSGSIQITAPDPDPDPDPPKFSGSGWIRIAPKQTKTLGKKS